MVSKIRTKRILLRAVVAAILAAAAAAAAFAWAWSAAAKRGEVTIRQPLAFSAGEFPLGSRAVATAEIFVPWGQKLTAAVNEITPECGAFAAAEPELERNRLHWGGVLYTVKAPVIPYRTGEIQAGTLRFEYLRPGAENELSPAVSAMAYPVFTATPVEVDRSAELPLAGELGDPARKVNYKLLAIIALAAAVVMAAAAYVYRRLKRNNYEWFAPPTAWEKALTELEQLRVEAKSIGRRSLCYTPLSDILRRYLEQRFQLPATTATTPEFLRALRYGASPLSESQRGMLGNFMEQADLVKFAKVEPDEPTFENSVKTAENFVRETVPSEEEATAKEGARHV